MPWLKKGGSFIERAEANEMIERYQSANPKFIKSIYFDNEKIKELLSQGGEGVSIFFAQNTDGSNTVVLQAIDGEGKIILDAKPLEVGNPCPPNCPT